MITYEKLFIILKKQNKNKRWLRLNGINPKTVDKLINNKNITTQTIDNLCTLLDCTPFDIMTYTPNQKEGEK